MNDLIQRLRADINEIRKSQDRTGKKSERVFRWEGVEVNPNGWRKYGDLADDLEELLNANPGLGDTLRKDPSSLDASQSETAGSDSSSLLPSPDQ